MLTQLAALQAAKTVGGHVARGLSAPVSGEGQLGDTITRMGTKSLIEYTQSTRVEPIVLLDTGCVHLPYIEDILKVVNSLFAAYYLQAVAISVNVGRVDTVRLLDRLNPNRSVANAAGVFIGDVFSGESDSLELPRISNEIKASLESDDFDQFTIASMESFDTFKKNAGTYINNQIDAMETVGTNLQRGSVQLDGDYKKHTKGKLAGTDIVDAKGNKQAHYTKIGSKNDIDGGGGARTITDVSEITNLCIGKLLDVHINSGGSSAVIPVQVRLIVSGIAENILVNIFKAAAKNMTFTERYHSWRSGQISFWKEFVLCRDILRDHRETLRGDKSGTYAAMQARARNNTTAGVLARDPSVAQQSNIAVLSTQTVQEIEYAIGGKLSEFKLREQIFERTMLMLMVIIDQRRERVTIYHQSIPLPTTLNLNAIRSVNKGTGPDVTKIIETLLKGQAPSF